MANWSLTLYGYAFNVVDVAIVVLCLISAISAASRGFAIEFSSRSGLLMGAIVGLVFSKTVAIMIADSIGLPQTWATAVAFVVLFVIGYLCMMTLGAILRRTLDALMLDWLDGLLGFGLGILEALLVVAFLIYALQGQSVVDIGLYVNRSVIYTELLRGIALGGIEIVKGVMDGR